MALKQDCEVVADRVHRILALIRVRQLATIELEDNPDLTIVVTPEMKLEYNARVQALKDEVKAITGAW